MLTLFSRWQSNCYVLYRADVGNSEIYILDLKQEFQRITNNSSIDVSASFADGRKLVFNSDRGEDIYTQLINGKNVKRISREASYYMIWSPRGT